MPHHGIALDPRDLINIAPGMVFNAAPRKPTSVYVIGSLRNPQVPLVAEAIRAAGYDAFDDWYAAGPEADDYWQKYEKARGHSFIEALDGYAANHVFSYDDSHITRTEMSVLVLPAGKSGHLEFGVSRGRGKPGFILLDKEPERFDVMYRYATRVVIGVPQLIEEMKKVLLP